MGKPFLPVIRFSSVCCKSPHREATVEAASVARTHRRESDVPSRAHTRHPTRRQRSSATPPIPRFTTAPLNAPFPVHSRRSWGRLRPPHAALPRPFPPPPLSCPFALS